MRLGRSFVVGVSVPSNKIKTFVSVALPKGQDNTPGSCLSRITLSPPSDEPSISMYICKYARSKQLHKYVDGPRADQSKFWSGLDGGRPATGPASCFFFALSSHVPSSAWASRIVEWSALHPREPLHKTAARQDVRRRQFVSYESHIYRWPDRLLTPRNRCTAAKGRDGALRDWRGQRDKDRLDISGIEVYLPCQDGDNRTNQSVITACGPPYLLHCG